METRVSQAHFRQTVEVWRWNLPSKRAPLTKAGVIDQNDQDIRRASGSFGEGPLSLVLDLCRYVRSWRP
jgi:hypothetical protein